MKASRISLKSLLTVGALAMLISAPVAHAECGDAVIDGIEQCDGGDCCQEDCTFAPAETLCRAAVSAECDVDEVCSGDSATCGDDVLFECGDSDGVDCTVPTCEDTGKCVEVDTCIQTCRGPGYWATHSGSEKEGLNIGQSVLNEAGPLEVCGQSVSLTNDIGSLSSSLEGLCVRTRGVKQRQLYRQLLTTAFNCAISEGGSCDQIVDRFADVSYSACNALCADGPVEDGPTLNDCQKQLGCFNKGGHIVDGECALGTCEVDTETLCGADYGSCPAIDDAPQACDRFPDNCRASGICNEDLDAPATICPEKGRASSPNTCRDARKNTCTIDSCEE